MIFEAVVSNTSKDFEQLVSCSWLRVFQELVRASTFAFGGLYRIRVINKNVIQGNSFRKLSDYLIQRVG